MKRCRLGEGTSKKKWKRRKGGEEKRGIGEADTQDENGRDEMDHKRNVEKGRKRGSGAELEGK